MPTSTQNRIVRGAGVLLVAAAALAWASVALAGSGGQVAPADAHVLGYLLAQAAGATAAFNVGPRTPDTLPDVPFQILYIGPGPAGTTFVVKPGTMLYVPVFFSHDSPPVVGDFPADVSDQEDDADYFFDPDELGASDLTVTVDGKATELGPDYVAGATTAPLPDGGGTHYIAVAAFLTPLSKGTHTVTISGAVAGAAWAPFGGGFTFEIPFTVIVRN